MFRRIVVFSLILLLTTSQSYSKPAWKDQPYSKGGSAGSRIANEAGDAIADILTGEDSNYRHKSNKLPPGLAKKGKTPPGWSKGKKTGWDKEKKDSPIKSFFKGLFGQSD